MPEGLIIFAGGLVAFEWAAARFGRTTRDAEDWFTHDVLERGSR